MNPGSLVDRACDWMWPFEGPTITFQDFLSECNTGDIMLFSGNGGWWTKFWTWSHFTHVSLVYRSPKTQKTYQWQSTTSPHELDLLTHQKNRDGPQALDLQTSVMNYAIKYGDLIAWRPLVYSANNSECFQRKIPKQKMEEVNHGFQTVMAATEGWGFQHDSRDMTGGRDFFLQYLPHPFGRRPDFNRKIFCAPLASWTLEESRILRKACPIGNYSPASFHDKTDQLFLEDNWGYGPTYRIIFDNKRYLLK